MVELGDALFGQFFASGFDKGLFPFKFGLHCLRLPDVGGFIKGSSIKFLILSSRDYFLPRLYYQLRQFFLLLLVHA
jgi:hypothetical protein